jgi:hypothetical protein
MKELFAGLALGLLMTSAQAQAQTYVQMGIGSSTCAQYLNLYRLDPNGTEQAYFDWAQGFLSGWNLGRMDAKKPVIDLASISIVSQQEYLRSYCDKHPLSDFASGVLTLITRLKVSPGD